MVRKRGSFRVGRVRADLRGRIWSLCYQENGNRHRPRFGPDREVARQVAAQTNAQIEVGAPALLSFEPISITELRDRWLRHHVQVLRSSNATINRYRTATDHLLNFLRDVRPVWQASQFHAHHAEEFVHHLRSIRVAPNGHANARKRPVLDKGIKYILEACRAMFGYSLKRRHLSPYSENPFSVLEIDRIPVEEARPIVLFTPEQESAFLDACDDWQLPIFLTLMLTGLRPGELVHLLWPEDLDLDAGILHVRNKPKLGWQVKTRSERDIPMIPVLAEVLRRHLSSRNSGPVFRRRRFADKRPPLAGMAAQRLERELAILVSRGEQRMGRPLERSKRLALARSLWRDAGAIKEERVRLEFMRLTRSIGLHEVTAPKLLRHQFATCLQDANTDPLVRNELMGHSPGSMRARGLGMTAVYTHTRPDTKRAQLEAAQRSRPALEVN